MSTQHLHTELLAQAGRLLLEYNESTGAIHRALMATSRALVGGDCHVAVAFNGLAVFLAGEAPLVMPVRELHFNTAVQARVHVILGQVPRGEIEPGAVLAQLARVEDDSPRHPRWAAVLMLGVAAASLAGLLGADAGAAAVAGLAAFIGAALGGLAVRLGATRTPSLVLLVLALMLVPGPHLINAALALIDNHLPMSLTRLGLAAGVLLATALGILLGWN